MIFQHKKLSDLIAKCLKDPKLLNKLKQDPKKVIESELNVKLPESFQLEVLQETPEKGYIVIPSKEKIEEFQDEELKTVSGGAGGQAVRTQSSDPNCGTQSWTCFNIP